MRAKLPLAMLLGAVLTTTAMLSAPARADRDDHHRGYERHHRGYERHHRGYEGHHRGYENRYWGREHHYRDRDDRRYRRHVVVDRRYIPVWRVQRFYRYAYGPHWRGHYRHAGPGWYFSGSRIVVDNDAADIIRAAVAAGLIVDIVNHH